MYYHRELEPSFYVTFLRSTALAWTALFAYIFDKERPASYEILMTVTVVVGYLLCATNIKLKRDIFDRAPLLVNIVAPIVQGIYSARYVFFFRGRNLLIIYFFSLRFFFLFGFVL